MLYCVFVAAVAYDGLYAGHTAVSDRSRLKLAIAIAVFMVLWGNVYIAIKILRFSFGQ